LERMREEVVMAYCKALSQKYWQPERHAELFCFSLSHGIHINWCHQLHTPSQTALWHHTVPTCIPWVILLPEHKIKLLALSEDDEIIRNENYTEPCKVVTVVACLLLYSAKGLRMTWMWEVRCIVTWLAPSEQNILTQHTLETQKIK
jgi:hypothetical protein